VPAFDPADLDAVYGNRILLESLGVSLAVPHLHPDALARQRETLAEMARTADPERWDAQHRAFHSGLVGPDGAPLRAEIARLIARSERYRLLSVRGDSSDGRRAGTHEHEGILAACAAGEAERAATLLAQHLARSAMTVIGNLAPDFDPATVRGALQMVVGWASR
jgi:DNA-binding GntR family transcriptional regulator